MNTCKRGLSYVTEEMLQCVRERCLDKKVHYTVVINHNPRLVCAFLWWYCREAGMRSRCE